MTQSLNTSVSEEKIGRLKDLLTPVLRRLLQSEEQAQELIECPEFVTGFEGFASKLLARFTNTFTVVAKRVDYTRTPMEAIRATGRAEYLDEGIVNTMPRRCQGVVENVEVVFFRAKRQLTTEEQEQECAQCNLDLDPYAQAAINEQDPAFADNYPNGSQWDRKGKVASYLAFDRWSGRRKVICDHNDDDWYGRWWFAGVRKSSPPQAEK